MMYNAHEEITEHLPAYSLGILEPELVPAVEEHVRGCESCRAELAGLRQATLALSLSAPDVAPPAGARDRFARMLVAEVSAPASSPSPAAPAAPEAARSAALPASAAPPPPRRGEVTQPAPRRWSWFSPGWAAAAALGALFVLAGLWGMGQRGELDRQRGELARLQQQLADQQSAQAQIEQERNLAVQLLGSTGARAYSLAATGAASGEARLWVDEQSRRAMLVTRNLGPAPAGKVYELWLIGDRPVAIDVFNEPAGAPGVLIFDLPGPLDSFGVAAVTVEERLVDAPTTEPILVAEI